MIPYARQSISENDIDAVVKVLRSDFITQGPVVTQFERAVSHYCSSQYSIAVSNGTAALHLACLALGVSSDDIVWTSPNTFAASANCALYCGAEIDFVDIDPDTYNISVAALKIKLQWAEKNTCLPKVLIAVHFAGQCCEMKEIKALSERYGFKIIEDAAHALGGDYLDQKIGSCRYSDITIFSFHPAKMITSGEGGMLLTNVADLAASIELLATHGITKDSELMTLASHGDWYYQQLKLGFNYRITDFQAALGLSQLQRLDEFVKKRRQLVQYYNDKLAELPLTTPWQHPDSQSCWHLYVIRLDLDRIGKTRKEVFDQLRLSDIGVHVHYIPVHTQPYYQQLGFKWGDFPESENYYKEVLTLPLYVDLTESNIDYIIQKIREVI
ncbi:MAG: UDP-4-amino-4,6-dideoxy-N-acetyl-beta-L-altrosamine transaminase [gamma proteobacterium symbiont of Taylorina sp.]|nr:UDP-4-amino-4,6-dideoxy-N-acetyl-beta-L-altrosamine transaminase [gamma proteobacterium symbiont of Taylorina sp.]